MAFSTHDQVPDSPTNVFATLNPLFRNSSLMSDGNTKFNKSTIGWATGIGTINLNNGNKYYFEGMPTLVGGSNSGIFIGLSKDSATQDTYGVNGIWSFGGTGSTLKIYNQTTLVSPTGSSAASDVFKVCFDSSNGYLWFGKNSDWYDSSGGTTGNPSTNLNPSVTINDTDSLFPIVIAYANAIIFNHGQDPTFGGSKSPSSTYTDANGIGAFYYQPPTGALALCTANLPDPAIDPNADDLPEDYMKVVKYIGDNATWQDNPDGQDVTVGFQPDLVWWKNRDSSVAGHYISDTVRGITEILNPSSTNGQTAFDTTHKQSYGYITQVNSNGFRIAKGTTTAAVETNSSSNNYIAWCFRAGGSPSATDDGTGVSGSAKLVDTSGTASSTTCKSFKDAAVNAGASNVICPSKMSINQKAGFSIIKYTGTGSAATVPHGLSSAPQMIIGKSLDASRSWNVYHVSTGNTGILQLDLTTAFYANSVYWQNTSPTSTVFSIGTQSEMNSAENIIAYCWHSVAGYSAFGSYTGNASTDGPFVYTGFKPAWVMLKNIDTTSDWIIYDSTRNTYNPMGFRIYPNLSLNESGLSSFMDFVSNGFKIRSNSSFNSANTFIYACFAEQPFKYATAR